MNITRWDPLREFEDMFHRYSPLFGREWRRNGEEQWTPLADIRESDKEYLIKAELPEVKKEDVNITFEDGVLTISGERRQEKEATEENEIRVERCYGTFSRSFSLPEHIDASGIRAEAQDGVLRIHIPKTEAAKPRSIAIEVK